MKKGLAGLPAIIIVALVVAGAGFYIYTNKGSWNGGSNDDYAAMSGKDLAVADVAGFFNAILSCTKSGGGSTPCFDTAFKSANTSGNYDHPLYQLVDFTGDGKLDAVVTIYYTGSGSHRDFYALSADASVPGDKTKGITLNYSEKGKGFSKSAAQPYYRSGAVTLICATSAPCGTKVLEWNKTAKTFTPKTTSSGSTVNAKAAQITSVTPTLGPVSTLLTLTGSKFSAQGGSVILVPQFTHPISQRIVGTTPKAGTKPTSGSETSADGKTVKVRLYPIDFHYENCGTNCSAKVTLPTGTYLMSVLNSDCTGNNCESNKVSFTVTAN